MIPARLASLIICIISVYCIIACFTAVTVCSDLHRFIYFTAYWFLILTMVDYINNQYWDYCCHTFVFTLWTKVHRFCVLGLFCVVCITCNTCVTGGYVLILNMINEVFWDQGLLCMAVWDQFLLQFFVVLSSMSAYWLDWVIVFLYLLSPYN